MSFVNKLLNFSEITIKFNQLEKNSSEKKIENIIQKSKENSEFFDFSLSAAEFFLLISPFAEKYIEDMALLAKKKTALRFGNTIQLFAPIYISNECNATCTYCSFSFANKINRSTLSTAQIHREAQTLFKMGIRHVLVLTGEDQKKTSLYKLTSTIKILKEYFPSVSMEIYTLNEAHYRELILAGADGLTLYQETYDPDIYQKVHIGGRKKNFARRIEAIEQAAKAGFRFLGMGILCGLSQFRSDVYIIAAHIKYMKKKYWKSIYSVSLPRLRPAINNFKQEINISDRQLAQMFFALRLYLPDINIVLSTRESQYFRDNIAGIAVNVMSAGSKTSPGGYNNSTAQTQFSINDARPVHEVITNLKSRGFQTIQKDWDRSFHT